ncbi:MAG: hypothetical protein WC889_19610 [Myxococcota bacterium]|jgi:hypothetical protein
MNLTRTGIFRIPKDPLQACIRVASGQQLSGRLFLDFALDETCLHERISGFLESEQMFFPFVPEGEHKSVFLNKDTLAVLDAEMESSWIEGVLTGDLLKKNSVAVTMTDGTEIRGELLSEVPEDLVRLSDRINSSSRFMKVMSGKRLYYLNTTHIARVSETALQL